MSTQVADLLEANEELAAKLARLEHLLTRNSSNSSIPPSKDDDPGRTPPAAKPQRRVGGPKRARGKQPGAPGANLAWADNPTKQIDRFPTGPCECGHDLAGATDLGIVDRYQQHELPLISVTVTQYDQHQVRCGCGRLHTATRPEGARTGLVGYGPNLQSFAVYLMVVHFIPATRVVEVLQSLTGATPASGSCTACSTAPQHCYHQLCCQHLLRDLAGAAETYSDAHWPTQITDALRGLIHHANLARDAGRRALNDAVRDKLINNFRDGVKVGLSDTTSHGTKPGERKARLLLEVVGDREDDVLRFAHDLRVPPTSNQAERDLRPAKIQQKISGRLTSEARTKDRYLIRGYLSTAAKHGRNTIDALREAILGHPWMPPDPAPT
ncbi:IS66 family transposase [Saccharopolyspora hattusasensis]|uniref:IS66 family transposase n=1 Tax=Saccharopolyspora hattusasensis TaxID=1128679 RepID=UPI003D951D99